MSYDAAVFATEVTNSVQAVANLSTDPANQIRTLSNLYASMTSQSTYEASLIRCTILAQILLSVYNYNLVSQNDAQNLLNQLLPLYDNELTLTSDSLVFSEMKTLRSKLSDDLITRGLQLPSVITITNTESLPALVVAYRQFADATRAREIVKMNNITDSNFCPLVLQVLSK